MSTFKYGNGYYLDKESFSSVTFEKLWDKLFAYVKDHALMSDKIKYDEHAGKIIITSDANSVNPIIKLDLENDLRLEKQLIRITQLNTKFDKLNKNLALSEENVEEFPNYNTISYQYACENKNINGMDSLFFHESALADYTKNFDKNEYLACQDYLMIVTFKNIKNVIDNSTGTVNTFTFNDMIFVCYDKATQKLVNVVFPILNAGTSLNVSDFITVYNENPQSLDTAFHRIIEEDGKTITNSYTDFKSAVSMFKLIHRDELEFINFKSFNSIMYEKFIENLKTKLTRI